MRTRDIMGDSVGAALTTDEDTTTKPQVGEEPVVFVTKPVNVRSLKGLVGDRIETSTMVSTPADTKLRLINDGCVGTICSWCCEWVVVGGWPGYTVRCEVTLHTQIWTKPKRAHWLHTDSRRLGPLRLDRDWPQMQCCS